MKGNDALGEVDARKTPKAHKCKHLRASVETGAAALHQSDHPKDSHGAHQGRDVPDALLDAAVKRLMQQDMSAWQAFEQACRELGGEVVEEGPDSSCRH